MASITAGDGAAAAGLPTPEEVPIVHNPTVCHKQTYLGHEALRQDHLPIQEGGLGLTSSSSIKGAASVGCHVLVLERVIAASIRGNLPSIPERQPERPIASSLIEELKTVVTDAKRRQKRDAMGSSWTALAVKENPQRRGIGTLLVQAGTRGGREGAKGSGRGGGEKGDLGAGALISENNGRIRSQASLIGILNRARATKGRGGVRGGCTPRPIKALARPPLAPWEEAPARFPNLGTYGNEESCGKVQESAGEGRGGICRIQDGGLHVEGDLRQEPRAA